MKNQYSGKYHFFILFFLISCNSFETATEICDDGIDNDNDNMYDCVDPDCFEDKACQIPNNSNNTNNINNINNQGICGNDIIDSAEECDGENIGENNCMDIVNLFGKPGCDDLCRLDYNFGCHAYIQGGNAFSNYIRAIGVDNDFNIYAAGETLYNGEQNIFLVKYNFFGERIAYQEFGTNDTDVVSDLLVNNYGDIFIAGKTKGTFPEKINLGDFDAYLLKIVETPQSEDYFTVNWSLQRGSVENDFFTALALDNSNIYACGSTMGVMTESSETQNMGQFDIFCFEIKDNGSSPSIINSFQTGSPGLDFINDIIFENHNQTLYFVGNTNGYFETGDPKNDNSFDQIDGYWSPGLDLHEIFQRVDETADVFGQGIALKKSDSGNENPHIQIFTVGYKEYPSTEDSLSYTTNYYFLHSVNASNLIVDEFTGDSNQEIKFHQVNVNDNKFFVSGTYRNDPTSTSEKTSVYVASYECIENFCNQEYSTHFDYPSEETVYGATLFNYITPPLLIVGGGTTGNLENYSNLGEIDYFLQLINFQPLDGK